MAEENGIEEFKTSRILDKLDKINKRIEEEKPESVKIKEELEKTKDRAEEVKKREQELEENYKKTARSIRTLEDIFDRLEDKEISLEGESLAERLEDLEEKQGRVKKVKELSEEINNVFKKGHPEDKSVKDLTGQEAYELPTMKGLVKGTDFDFSSDEDEERFKELYKQLHKERKKLEERELAEDMKNWEENKDLLQDLWEEGKLLKEINEVDLTNSDVHELDRELEKIEDRINEKRNTKQELWSQMEELKQEFNDKKDKEYSDWVEKKHKYLTKAEKALEDKDEDKKIEVREERQEFEETHEEAL